MRWLVEILLVSGLTYKDIVNWFLHEVCWTWVSFKNCSLTMQHPGFFGTLIDAEQKVADQGEKVWKKLPGVKDKKRKCQIHLEVSALKSAPVWLTPVKSNIISKIAKRRTDIPFQCRSLQAYSRCCYHGSLALWWLYSMQEDIAGIQYRDFMNQMISQVIWIFLMTAIIHSLAFKTSHFEASLPLHALIRHLYSILTSFWPPQMTSICYAGNAVHAR